ncbi:TPA: hypothetical protein ACH3X1_015429 [Trebouxia sp. C0004]
MSGRVSIWESTSGRCTHTLEGPGEAIEWVSWHPRGDVVLAGSEDFTAWMWHAQSGDMMQVFYGHTGAVRCGQFTPDGKAVVTGGGEGDATLKVWDPKSGSCTGTVQGHGFHEAGLTSLDISADSTVAITGSEDMTAKISNIHTGKVLGTFVGMPSQMTRSIGFKISMAVKSAVVCVHSNVHYYVPLTQRYD